MLSVKRFRASGLKAWCSHDQFQYPHGGVVDGIISGYLTGFSFLVFFNRKFHRIQHNIGVETGEDDAAGDKRQMKSFNAFAGSER